MKRDEYHIKLINENKNFTLSYLGGGTGAAFDLIYNENSIGYNYPTDSTNNKFIY